MSRSLIQTANQSSQTVAEGSVISLGQALRRFGCNCRLNGNAIEVSGEGYYTIDADVTVVPTAIGNVSVGVYVDGTLVPSAIATGSVSTVGNAVTLPINTTIRQGCCCDSSDSITVVLISGESTITNVSVRVQKV